MNTLTTTQTAVRDNVTIKLLDILAARTMYSALIIHAVTVAIML